MAKAGICGVSSSPLPGGSRNHTKCWKCSGNIKPRYSYSKPTRGDWQRGPPRLHEENPFAGPPGDWTQPQNGPTTANVSLAPYRLLSHQLQSNVFNHWRNDYHQELPKALRANIFELWRKQFSLPRQLPTLKDNLGQSLRHNKVYMPVQSQTDEHNMH